MRNGEKLVHEKAAGYVSEYADQVVGVAFGAGADAKVSLTFGRDKISIPHETFVEVAPGQIQTQVGEDDFSLVRVDIANIVMDLGAAIRLRDMLNSVIENASNQSAVRR